MLVELCDVGGKRDGVGAAVWNAVPPEGGDGLKVILIRFTTQTQQKDKAALRQRCLFYAGQHVCELIGRVGTASFVLLVCLSGET